MRMHQRKRTKLKFAILISFLSTFRHSSLTIVQTILLEENRRRLSAPPCRTVGPKCSTYKTGVKREEPWDAPVRRPDRRPITRTQINGVAPSAAQPTLCRMAKGDPDHHHHHHPPFPTLAPPCPPPSLPPIGYRICGRTVTACPGPMIAPIR